MHKKEQTKQEGGAVVFLVMFTIWLLLVFWFTLGVYGWIH